MKCDKCGKIATHNVQINFYLEEYTIDKKGDYHPVSSEFLDSDENHHYCDKCYKEQE